MRPWIRSITASAEGEQQDKEQGEEPRLKESEENSKLHLIKTRTLYSNNGMNGFALTTLFDFLNLIKLI